MTIKIRYFNLQTGIYFQLHAAFKRYVIYTVALEAN